MKKLGLRALASGLALLMVAGLGAPAAATAQDDLLILAPAKGLKVLEITEDMVDEDGEIVISGGEYDRVVISRNVDAKDIYFDQVVVKEMVVESGNKTNVQLWEVDADQVTVQEPQIEAFPIKELLPLLKDADENTRQAAVDAFNAYQAEVKDVSVKAPTIVTMDDAKVDELVARANAKLDLGKGAVEVVALEAGEKATRANVTLSNYEGNVTYKGGEGFSAMNLKAVDSHIKTLKVDESAVNNYFTLTSQDTVVLNTEVAGNASVTLNALMGAVEITEAATAANVAIMNVVEELKVAGKDAKVELAGNANVTFATVTSDNVKITGAGTLGEADLQGKGAYVSTFGTKVEGVNTYVPYTVPLYDSWSEDFSDAELVAGVPTDGGSMNWATYAYDAENGYGIVKTTAGWQGFAIELDNRDNGSGASYTINLKVKKLGGVTEAVRVTENPAWPNLANITSIGDDWTYIRAEKVTVAAGATRVILIAPEVGQEGVTMELAVDDVRVERYTQWTEPPARPKPTENVTYDFSQMTLGTNYGVTTNVQDGVLNITYDAQYQEAQYNLPVGMFTDDYDRIVVHMSDCTGTVDFKIIAGGKNILDNYGKDGTCILDLSSVPGYEVTTIGIMQDNAGSCSAVIEGFTFVVAGSDYELQTEGPKAPVALPEDALVYGVKDLESTISGYGYTVEDAEHDGLKVVISDAGYQEIQFNLPEAVVAGEYEKMIVTVSSTTNAFAVKAGGKDWYNNSATKTTDLEFDLSKLTADVTQVGLMAGETTGTEFVVYRIAFLPKAEEAPPTPELAPNTYTFKDLTQTMIWDATSSVDASTGAITMSFPASYKQVFFEIPADIDVTKLESITFNGLVGSSYAIKLQTVEEYNKYDGSAAITVYDNATAATGGSEVKYFVFMSNDSTATADAPQVLTVESVTFNLK